MKIHWGSSRRSMREASSSWGIAEIVGLEVFILDDLWFCRCTLAEKKPLLTARAALLGSRWTDLANIKVPHLLKSLCELPVTYLIVYRWHTGVLQVNISRALVCWLSEGQWAGGPVPNIGEWHKLFICKTQLTLPCQENILGCSCGAATLWWVSLST